MIEQNSIFFSVKILRGWDDSFSTSNDINNSKNENNNDDKSTNENNSDNNHNDYDS